MKTKLVTSLILLSSFIDAQTWSGSGSNTGDAYRFGRVGIGLSSPTTLLDVNGGWSHFVYNTQNLPPSDPFGGLSIGWNRIGASNAEVNFYNVYDNAPTSFLFSQKTGAGSVKDLVRFKSNGNVGVGIDPSTILHVFKSGGDAAIRIQNEYNINGYQNRAYDLITSAGQLATSGHFAIVDVNNNAQRFGIDGTTGMVYIGARIGFGNTHNNAIFTANGKAVFKEVIVTSNWADYVFDSGYELEPLENVSSFIRENHHLKGFKSAAEYEEEGLSVGDILKLQQEKIEELTLYMIDLKKQLDELRGTK